MKSLGIQHSITDGYSVLTKDNDTITQQAIFKVAEVPAESLTDPCKGCLKGGAVWGKGAQACRMCAPH